MFERLLTGELLHSRKHLHEDLLGEILFRLAAREMISDNRNDERIEHIYNLAADGLITPANCFEDFRRNTGLSVIHRGVWREVENLPNILTQDS